MVLMIVSGRSGSGKSVALRALEDMGFYCVDNLPVVLLPELARTLADRDISAAVSIDVRNMPESPEIFEPARICRLKARSTKRAICLSRCAPVRI